MTSLAWLDDTQDTKYNLFIPHFNYRLVYIPISRDHISVQQNGTDRLTNKISTLAIEAPAGPVFSATGLINQLIKAGADSKALMLIRSLPFEMREVAGKVRLSGISCNLEGNTNELHNSRRALRRTSIVFRWCANE